MAPEPQCTSSHPGAAKPHKGRNRVQRVGFRAEGLEKGLGVPGSVGDIATVDDIKSCITRNKERTHNSHSLGVLKVMLRIYIINSTTNNHSDPKLNHQKPGKPCTFRD